MTEGVISSILVVSLTDGRKHADGGIKKKQAHSFYRISQQKEQEWRERRRVREVEEERASASGTLISMPASVDGPSHDDPLVKLANAVFNQELISQAEYETVKSNFPKNMLREQLARIANGF